MSTLLAIAVMVVVMAVVGYALARLAEPMSSLVARGSETHKDQEGHKALHSDRELEQQQTQSDDQLVEEVNQRLPQTQCAQCGHPGCRPYAEAIIRDNAPINQCPPGGEALIEELANLLGAPVMALDSRRGETKSAQVAVIIEPDCIGCTLCIAACPVDAIVGAQKHMHTVIADLCTGCELCLPPCPVDCIVLHPVKTPLHRWQWPRPA